MPGYVDSLFLNQSLSVETVAASSTGYQDRSYNAAVAYNCREELGGDMVTGPNGETVLDTSLLFVEAGIFTTPDFTARYTLPSGEVSRLLKAEAIKEIADASIIHHWELYFG